MLVTSKQIILDAQRGKYAIGAFNTSDMEITKAIIWAAEKMKSPVIIQTSEKAIAYAGLEEITAIVKVEAKKSKVPVALHLDHGSKLEVISECIKAGYTSVMFDGSRLPLAENIIFTRQAVEMSHRAGIPCEAELGAVRKVGEEESFTDPSEVAEFVKKTGVDFLATAIGTAHGVIVGHTDKPKIDLLKKIRRKTSVPLVLHGASDVSDEDIKSVVANGICKINIDTDIRHTFAETIREMAKKNLDDPRDIMAQVMKDIQKLIEGKIETFGSKDKA
ncbi:TPA: class II fructose-bisphosphate aldolase [Candidatus Berkelbacteria bacterium]|uniref:Class II fructose-1,6-bisphosphate aldolase, fructose-bisphosphate aldolase, class II n=1 Tax=Berkelbacteria bacterium GW2011_GWE1_39_12 TaxID=1618337 RepID=A0A0G4B327_9BACT|nr:MAG: class II fructose-1,6-bisphosphate aldolase, fructose-bisphosphate aldolase, class II [Berkelbacteria bacterium GW2011_GWE1_39_12]HBO60621.1 class II fructose-bisphosphate aldolase [Candidatus Berkelbacteria bacterium]